MRKGKAITYEMGGVVYDRTLDINDIAVARAKNLPIYEVSSFGKTLELSPRIPLIRQVVNRYLPKEGGKKVIGSLGHIKVRRLVGARKHELNLHKFMQGHIN